MKIIRKKIIVQGIVQGVGFRPFVYRLANELSLTGFVLNDASGLTIEIQGPIEKNEEFVSKLKLQPPPLARIDNIDIKQLRTLNEKDFVIEQTQNEQTAVVMVSPDKSSCPDCLADLTKPNDRHFKYPFTNCTNCGPRYSIIKSLPYDRSNTSMDSFEMCNACSKEYNNVANRRYHAQPVSCPFCGPKITIKNNLGETISDSVTNFNIISSAIKSGKILAIKGLGGFHLVCDATNYDAVALLRNRKKRPLKPLAVMIPDIEFAKQIATGTDNEWQILSSIEKPIVLMKKKQYPEKSNTNFDKHSNTDKTENYKIADNVAPNIDKIGLFLPYTPLHQIILSDIRIPLVATSANISGEPVIGNCENIVKLLGNVVDLIIDNNRDIINCCDDSVVQYNAGFQALRLARGYAPYSFHIDMDKNTNNNIIDTNRNLNILAVGAQQKNTISLAFKQNIILSPHIGDLYSIEAEEYFIRTLQTFNHLYDFRPYVIVSDLHPEYTSTKWAKKFTKHNNIVLIQVQHHYAHILSVMAKNNFTKNVLGFSFDGTGAGEPTEKNHVNNDSNYKGNKADLWGGEVFIADAHNYKHVAHLQNFKLIGGEIAIKEPMRIFLAILFEFYSLEEVLNLSLNTIKKISPEYITNLHKIWQQPACLRTSSVGRLFDAIAYALEIVDEINYEGESGLRIEALANQLYDLHGNKLLDTNIAPINLKFEIVDNIISIKPLIDGIIQTLSKNQDENFNNQLQSQLSSGFMLALVDMMFEVNDKYNKQGLPIVLSGGVFQNKFLYTKAIEKLGIERCLLANEVPVNDGGIALGQMWYALNNLENTHIN